MKLLSAIPRAEADALAAQVMSPGLPLRAVMPLQAHCSGQDQERLALRGGFCCPLPGTERLPLHAYRPQSAPAHDTWSQFPESFAATVLALKNEKCAPPVIVWMPKGVHCIRPEGNPGAGPIVCKVDATTAAIANRHLQALRAKAAAGAGAAPFIDFDHQGGIAGEVTEIFWDAGIRAAVNWTPEGEQAVLQGTAVSFSPHWITHGGEFLGLRACVGGVLSPGVDPAFKKMPALAPWQKRKALHYSADRFMRKVDCRAAELTGQGVELAALQAFEDVVAEFPALHACHQLREAIRDEHWQDIVLKHA